MKGEYRALERVLWGLAILAVAGAGALVAVIVSAVWVVLTRGLL